MGKFFATFSKAIYLIKNVFWCFILLVAWNLIKNQRNGWMEKVCSSQINGGYEYGNIGNILKNSKLKKIGFAQNFCPFLCRKIANNVSFSVLRHWNCVLASFLHGLHVAKIVHTYQIEQSACLTTFANKTQ